MTARVRDAVAVLEGLTLEDVHHVLKVLPQVVHQHASSLERHGTVDSARMRGFLLECGGKLEQADALLREALHRH